MCGQRIRVVFRLYFPTLFLFLSLSRLYSYHYKFSNLCMMVINKILALCRMFFAINPPSFRLFQLARALSLVDDLISNAYTIKSCTAITKLTARKDIGLQSCIAAQLIRFGSDSDLLPDQVASCKTQKCIQLNYMSLSKCKYADNEEIKDTSDISYIVVDV